MINKQRLSPQKGAASFIITPSRPSVLIFNYLRAQINNLKKLIYHETQMDHLIVSIPCCHGVR